MNEIWKDIEGYEGLYQVSNLGRVKSLERMCRCRGDGVRKVPERILKPGLNGHGYLTVALSNEGVWVTYYVHNVTSQAFLYKKAGATEVNHKNGNKQDNKIANLEWVTGDENIEHSFREGLQPRPRKAIHMLTLDGNHVMTFSSGMEAARHLGKTTSGGISHVCNGSQETAYGYKWKYASEGDLL